MFRGSKRLRSFLIWWYLTHIGSHISLELNSAGNWVLWPNCSLNVTLWRINTFNICSQVWKLVNPPQRVFIYLNDILSWWFSLLTVSENTVWILLQCWIYFWRFDQIAGDCLPINLFKLGHPDICFRVPINWGSFAQLVCLLIVCVWCRSIASETSAWIRDSAQITLLHQLRSSKSWTSAVDKGSGRFRPTESSTGLVLVEHRNAHAFVCSICSLRSS